MRVLNRLINVEEKEMHWRVGHLLKDRYHKVSRPLFPRCLIVEAEVSPCGRVSLVGEEGPVYGSGRRVVVGPSIPRNYCETCRIVGLDFMSEILGPVGQEIASSVETIPGPIIRHGSKNFAATLRVNVTSTSVLVCHSFL